MFFLIQIVYNYPPKGRWIVVEIYQSAKRRGIYNYLCSRTLRRIVVWVFTIRWIKMKKVTFCKLKCHLVGTLFTIYKQFGDFVKCICTTSLQIQHENYFLPTSYHRQAKVRRFLGICFYDCFIYRPVSSSKIASKRDVILAPVAKQWLAKDIPSCGNQIKTSEDCYLLMWNILMSINRINDKESSLIFTEKFILTSCCQPGQNKCWWHPHHSCSCWCEFNAAKFWSRLR